MGNGFLRSVSAGFQSVRGRPFWFAFFTYWLFAASTFSITFSEFSIFFLLILATYQVSRERPPQTLPRWIVIPFVAWAGAVILSVIANPEPLTAIQLGAGELRKLLPFVLVAALAHVDLRRLVLIFGVAAAFFALYGYTQFFLGVDLLPGNPRGHTPLFPLPGWGVVYRARGNFSITIIFASVMAMIFPFFLALAATQKRRFRIFCGTVACLTAFALLFSVTRGAWVAAYFGTIAVFFRFPRRWAIPLVSGSLIFFGLVAVGLGSGYLPNKILKIAHDPFLARLGHATPKGNPLRMLMWESAFEGFKKTPWVGAGVNNRHALQPITGELLKKREPGLRNHLISEIRGTWGSGGPSALNGYLQILFTVGAVGFLAHFSIWGALFYWNYRWIRRGGREFPMETGLLWATTAGLVANLFDSFFQNNFYHANVQTIVMMYFGLSLFVGLKIQRGLKITAD